MRLLFDQNISFKLINKIKDTFPEAQQVRQLGIENYTDIEIWKYAKSHEYTIVTFDADFLDLSNLFGHPPKIIWLRVGNTSTDALSKIIILNAILLEFITAIYYSEFACLEIK